MESNWDQFTKILEDKVDARIAPLEAQLSTQQELIQKLTSTLQGLIERFTPKPHNSLDLSKLRTAGPKSKSDKQVSKTQASDHDEEKSTEAGNS